MRIRMPATRACYPSSRNEPDRLLCWIPRDELEQLAAEGRVDAKTLEYYPSGLEVRLSREGFREFGLDLDVDPERLHEAYQALRQAGALPESGYVSGTHLEEVAKSGSIRGGRSLPEPKWTDGQDPRVVMGKLQ